MDTGLCAFLVGWLTPEVLERGAMSGAMLETWVISEIVKSYLHHGRTPRVSFYRDKEKREIDLLIEENETLYPIEIKKTAAPQNAGFKGFDMLLRVTSSRDSDPMSSSPRKRGPSGFKNAGFPLSRE